MVVDVETVDSDEESDDERQKTKMNKADFVAAVEMFAEASGAEGTFEESLSSKEEPMKPPPRSHAISGAYSMSFPTAGSVNSTTTKPSAHATTGAKPESVADGKTKDEENPGWWKLAGRAIKQNSPTGKYLLNSIQSGIKLSQRMMGFGFGNIHISLSETRVYQAEQVIHGIVSMELSQPTVAERLMVQLRGVREIMIRCEETNDQSKESEEIYSCTYEISGQCEYPCRGAFPFQIVVPRLRPKMSNETRSSLAGTLISSLQAVDASLQTPIQWTLEANLEISGVLFGPSDATVVHVAVEEC